MSGKTGALHYGIGGKRPHLDFRLDSLPYRSQYVRKWNQAQSRNMGWNASIGGKLYSATREDVLRLKRRFVGEGDLASRMSEMLWFDIMVLSEVYGIDPFEILGAVEEVESGEQSSTTKRSSQFTRRPLIGLWHKHYFSARFLAHNIILGLGRDGLRKIIEEELDPSKSDVITEEMLRAVAERTVREPYEARGHAGKITGEWIVFAKENGTNYYLCAATHQMGDGVIYDNIVNGCVRDFPELPEWLAQYQA